MSFHVLSAEFIHESNTFKRGRTTLRDFAAAVLLDGEAAIAALGHGNTEVAGFLDAARTHGWEMNHVISAHAYPGAPVAREAFDHIAARIIDAARARPYDGILLGLHGSMVPEFTDDGEGELLARLRAAIGRDIPIAVTLDLHAMVSPAMVELADIFVSYKTYPHVDMRLAGQHAGRLLDAAMAGAVKPRTVRAHRPMLEEVNSGRTDVAQTAALYDAAAAHEHEAGILAVSINAGFAEADTSILGPTVLVTYDEAVKGAAARAGEITEAIADRIWQGRKSKANLFLSVEDAALLAKAHKPVNGPLIIADYADNPGAGAYGDATALTAALLAADVEDAVVAPMIDPEAAAELHRHKVGDRVRLAIGGKQDPSFGGGPLELEGEILCLSDGRYIGNGPILNGLESCLGPTAVFRVGGVDILVTTESEQAIDQMQLVTFGIEPSARRVLALKSMQHFRAAFEPIADLVVVCDSGALATPQATKRPYVKAQRPIFPLDPDMEL
ncbi:M81 family metallopeptidase [Oryzibacter oryziterrae]|uniref:M81 family metallopeptidase n=1 Tax=Oryzibacter oryziterrae TaxID=2766474 RepID=UPI001F468A40|nr:M81 family metallopeptidase [Oryzibacter oryziterrae]